MNNSVILKMNLKMTKNSKVVFNQLKIIYICKKQKNQKKMIKIYTIVKQNIKIIIFKIREIQMKKNKKNNTNFQTKKNTNLFVMKKVSSKIYNKIKINLLILSQNPT